jgi:peptidoglycan/xylan/chitin deacetylase (PgdA/CDA1 family)
MVAVFHHIGPKDNFTNPIEEILAYDGIITFDGVYTSVYDHREALKGRDVIIFVAGDTVGKEGFCDWHQILKLVNHYGLKLGWHTWSHPRLNEVDSKQMMEEMESPFATDYFAYPYGEFNDETIAVAKLLGYKYALSTTQGNDDPLSFRREYI